MIHYVSYHIPSRDELIKLYNAVGWTSYTKTPDALEAGYQTSLYVLSAYCDNELVGVIRAVGDGHTIVYIQDLVVAPSHQRRGIGSALLKQLIKQYATVRQVILLCEEDEGVLAFYGSHQFINVQNFGCEALYCIRYRV